MTTIVSSCCRPRGGRLHLRMWSRAATNRRVGGSIPGSSDSKGRFPIMSNCSYKGCYAWCGLLYLHSTWQHLWTFPEHLDLLWAPTMLEHLEQSGQRKISGLGNAREAERRESERERGDGFQRQPEASPLPLAVSGATSPPGNDRGGEWTYDGKDSFTPSPAPSYHELRTKTENQIRFLFLASARLRVSDQSWVTQEVSGADKWEGKLSWINGEWSLLINHLLSSYSVGGRRAEELIKPPWTCQEESPAAYVPL